MNRDRPATVISPSILASDFAKLAEEAQRMSDCGVEWLHIDAMDGHYVPNLTLGPPIIASLRKHTKLFLDCHCMLSEPARWVDDFAKAGADGFTFHLDTFGSDHTGVRNLCKSIREAGMKAGIALRPSDSFKDVMPFVTDNLVDMVLVMTVNPGFGGQKFKIEMMNKVKALRALGGKDLNIQVDGGLSPATIEHAATAGANVIVAGSAIFGAEDPGAVIRTLRTSVDTAATCARVVAQ